MPAITAKIIPKTVSLIKGIISKNAKIAPNGSARPDKKEYFIAFFLEPVAKYIGTATSISSGIL